MPHKLMAGSLARVLLEAKRIHQLQVLFDYEERAAKPVPAQGKTQSSRAQCPLDHAIHGGGIIINQS